MFFLLVKYLEKRFDSKAAKLTGTIMMILQQVIYMGIASFVPSTALEAGRLSYIFQQVIQMV